MKEYSKGIYVKFKPEEVEILHNRMKEAGVQNMSAYIRKMALNGYVIIPEWPDLNQVISLHSRISNNLNQYARKANETGKLYEEDITEIKKMHNEQTILCGEQPSRHHRASGFRPGTETHGGKASRSEPQQLHQPFLKQDQVRRMRQLVRLEGVALQRQIQKGHLAM